MKGLIRKHKFFESLRPAQDTCAAGAARGKEPFKKEHQENIEAEPEIQNTDKKDNSTTKSLILAQDER